MTVLFPLRNSGRYAGEAVDTTLTNNSIENQTQSSSFNITLENSI